MIHCTQIEESQCFVAVGSESTPIRGSTIDFQTGNQNLLKTWLQLLKAKSKVSNCGFIYLSPVSKTGLDGPTCSA